jgi:hypothetical protein
MSLSHKNSPWNLQGLWSVPAFDTHPMLVITNNPNAAIRLWWETEAKNSEVNIVVSVKDLRVCCKRSGMDQAIRFQKCHGRL